MTTLTHGFDGAVDSSKRHDLVKDATKARLSAIKRFCLCALAVLLSGGLLAGAIALKTAIYFWGHHL